MKKPLVHIVAGFLGSGKTTAISNACKLLVAQQLRVGVITNDQGKYLVDSEFFDQLSYPTVEVSGGCFCCNYSDLETQLGELIERYQPDVIFAESVGSCADIVATVIKPLLLLNESPVPPSSFSVFVDARLLHHRFENVELPFSDDVVYLFDQQIEEASLLILNKVDTLSDDQLRKLIGEARKRWPTKVILPQVSLTVEGVSGWLLLIQSGTIKVPRESLDIDYARYTRGEQNLAWLDERLELQVSADRINECVRSLLRDLRLQFTRRAAGIGHIKIFIQPAEGNSFKVSLTPSRMDPWEDELQTISGNRVELMINARVEMPADQLKEIVDEVIHNVSDRYSTTMRVISIEAYHPNPPSPEFRI